MTRRTLERSASHFDRVAADAADQLRRAAEHFEIIAADAAQQLRESAALWETSTDGQPEDYDTPAGA